jgi:hypothetical protein
VIAELGNQPDVVFLALGTNDAGLWDGRDGWTSADEAVWTEVLGAVRPGTCVIILLPAVGPEAEANWPGVAASEDRARAWLTAAGADAGAVVSDSALWLDGVRIDDGIHLQDPAGVQARLAQMADAETHCTTGGIP